MKLTMKLMTTRAHIESDWMHDGVKIAVQLNPQQILRWGDPIVSTVKPEETAPDDAWLRLPLDVARAMYEALADHFGHSGHDTRALRKDYEAERARVDRLIEFATSPASIITQEVRP
jgi:hypothetical protein